ncbi:MAG: AraC family transcriptional regulator, partial [Anaerorhabdus sp.]
FKYFAGVHLVGSLEVEELELFNLLPGEYVVCKVEAENFESLVMDVLYKAQSFLYSSWLIQKGIQIEPIGIERYADHNEQTNSLEIWMKIKESII